MLVKWLVNWLITYGPNPWKFIFLNPNMKVWMMFSFSNGWFSSSMLVFWGIVSGPVKEFPYKGSVYLHQDLCSVSMSREIDIPIFVCTKYPIMGTWKIFSGFTTACIFQPCSAKLRAVHLHNSWKSTLTPTSTIMTGQPTPLTYPRQKLSYYIRAS